MYVAESMIGMLGPIYLPYEKEFKNDLGCGTELYNERHKLMNKKV